ncbi:class I SAM-dependent methyltransferase [Actinoplanes sp. TRM 88003]|uniref:Class I SAM-dependent methyltransferase n=1 Tax=Paractinoplanes aksuensis TaxID=2939490 RepID=A0ABT1DQ92_9ACTN|nr:class I SAM-dependent methyltransferase [Actinoplanes aksuensis]MCO8273018.1 class I SAM-dependent methyltransferase [Actinoplanes aksuensis]
MSEVKLADLGRALRLTAGASMLDLACGTGEMVSTWSRDHGITGLGVDISTVFGEQARRRASELGVGERVAFVHDDAAGFVAPEPVDIAACVGATWIGGGVPGTLDLLARSLRPGGLVLVGEPFWREDPPSDEAVRGCHAQARSDFHDLPGLVELFGRLGWDLVEMVLADEDSWDRYVAAQWMTIRTWLDANPDDELAPECHGSARLRPLPAPLSGLGSVRPKDA